MSCLQGATAPAAPGGNQSAPFGALGSTLQPPRPDRRAIVGTARMRTRDEAAVDEAEDAVQEDPEADPIDDEDRFLAENAGSESEEDSVGSRSAMQALMGMGDGTEGQELGGEESDGGGADGGVGEALATAAGEGEGEPARSERGRTV